MVTTVILWDCNGKLTAKLFASRAEAFKLEPVTDQPETDAVKVSTSDCFDASRDFLIRVVSKGGRTEDQLIFGTQPDTTSEVRSCQIAGK
ncbi:MAG: hypothetical protein K2X27_08220 [Candidatus Obscuribacterales bacterium]|nr:hypothetical protein [Candidatus Obscuribacterales bacterium]